MAHQLIALYNHPEDATAFDRHYDGTHAPLAAKFPKLRSFTLSRPGADPEGNPAPYHLVATLTWDSEADFNAAAGSEEFKAAVADLDNFAGAGVAIMTGPAEDIV